MTNVGAIDERISRAVTRANTANQLMSAALTEFNAHASAHDWDRAEEARLKTISHLEAYLDGMTETYKLLQRGTR